MEARREEPGLDLGVSEPRVRVARVDDDAALKRIDCLTWTSKVSPAPRPARTAPFFTSGTVPDNVLLVELNREVAGYVTLGSFEDLESSSHVVAITGLAVHPNFQRMGVGRLLVKSSIETSMQRGLGA
jgi:ribosomal protein S18 acetylase RimI-like enzyme